MKKILSALGIVIITITISSPVFALGGLEFLSKAPVAYFTPDDTKIFKDTLRDLLNNQPVRKVVKWKNQGSGHFGKMKLVKRFKQNDQTCRTVKFFNSAGGVTGQGTFDFCKYKDGKWKIYSENNKQVRSKK